MLVSCLTPVTQSFAFNTLNQNNSVIDGDNTLRIGVIPDSASDKVLPGSDNSRVYEVYLNSLKQILPTGTQIDVVKAPLSELLDLVKKEQIHAVFELSINEARNELLEFTDPIGHEVVFIFSQLDFEIGLKQTNEVYALNGSTWGQDAENYLRSIGYHNPVTYVDTISELYSKPVFVAGDTSLSKFYPHKLPIKSGSAIHIGITKTFAEDLLASFNSALEDVGNVFMQVNTPNSDVLNLDLIVDVDVEPFFSHDHSDISILSKYSYLSSKISNLNINPIECEDEECERDHYLSSRLTLYSEEQSRDFYQTESIGLLELELFTLKEPNQSKRIGVAQDSERTKFINGNKTIPYKCFNNLIDGFVNGEIDGFIANDLDGHLALAKLGYKNYRTQTVTYESVVFAIPKSMPNADGIYQSLSNVIKVAKNTGFIDSDVVKDAYMMENARQDKLTLRQKLIITYVVSSVTLIAFVFYKIRCLLVDKISRLYKKKLIKLYYSRGKYTHILCIKAYSENYDDINLESVCPDEPLVVLSKQLNYLKCLNFKGFRYLDDTVVLLVDCDDDTLIYRCIEEVCRKLNQHQLTMDIGIKGVSGNYNSDVKFALGSMFANRNEKNRGYCHYEHCNDAKNYINSRTTEKIINESLCNEEFDCYFQPKFDVNSNALYGVEVLARLRINDTYISPEQFIPILEERDNIHLLDYMMINKTVDHIVSNSRFDVNFSVNVSSKSIARPEFREKVVTLLSQYENLENLEFEITETLTRECFDLVEVFMSEIRRVSNVKISLDDFSTGNSSLLILDKIHFDTVKIDRSILQILRNKESENYHIYEIVKYIKSKASYVCLEGIEDIDDLNIARDLKVDFGQGWHYGKPMNEGEFNENYKTQLVIK
tara:strand:+ start:2893 stop:5541 length:2649 start_codon:yes stop_codon:yes gene_type:complete